MNILLIDIDTLRADHLGCYGYQRNTSPNIDRVARDGVCFEDYYCTDAPCLPSRAALMTGRFGFQSGVVGHGGKAADMYPDRMERIMTDRCGCENLPAILRKHNMHTVSFSTFAERHGAWWFNAGFNECYNVGKRGMENAPEVNSKVLHWLDHGCGKDWFMHVNFWDPHTPYRVPEEAGNPFEKEPVPNDWMTPEILQDHNEHKVGPHSSMEVRMYTDSPSPGMPRMLGSIKSMDDWKYNMDSYDTGILWADKAVGEILEKLRELGIYEETAIIITSDHGENIGELGLYDEHGTADYCTTRIPMIIKWPGGAKGHMVKGLYYNIDLIPTLMELMGELPDSATPQFMNPQKVTPEYDGRSYAASILSGDDVGRDYLVLSQCAHVCQRAVRFEDYIYIRTYHDGYHLFDTEMLFHIGDDPHETTNLASQRPELCHKAVYYLNEWHDDQMKKQMYKRQTDPLWIVMSEYGPFHANGFLVEYCKRLDATGRHWATTALRERHPQEWRNQDGRQ